MTGIILQRARGGVRIASDLAVWNSEGTLIHRLSKTMLLPEFNAAVAFRGSAMTPLIAQTIECAPSYGEFKRNVEFYLRDAIQTVFALKKAYVAQEMQFFVGHVDRDGQSDAWTLITHADGGLEPWKIHQIPDLMCAPCSAPMHSEVLDIAGERTADELNAADLLSMMEVQRTSGTDAGRPVNAFGWRCVSSH